MNQVPAHSFHPHIVILFCQNAVSDDAHLDHSIEESRSFTIKKRLLPCTGKIEIDYLLKLLESSVDGIQIIGCPSDECQFLQGSRRTQKRVERVRHMLDEIGMGADRIGMDQGHRLTDEQVLERVEKRAKVLCSLGPNPMKATESS